MKKILCNLTTTSHREWWQNMKSFLAIQFSHNKTMTTRNKPAPINHSPKMRRCRERMPTASCRSWFHGFNCILSPIPHQQQSKVVRVIQLYAYTVSHLLKHCIFGGTTSYILLNQNDNTPASGQLAGVFVMLKFVSDQAETGSDPSSEVAPSSSSRPEARLRPRRAVG